MALGTCDPGCLMTGSDLLSGATIVFSHPPASVLPVGLERADAEADRRV